jgi:hypothetical protein
MRNLVSKIEELEEEVDSEEGKLVLSKVLDILAEEGLTDIVFPGEELQILEDRARITVGKNYKVWKTELQWEDDDKSKPHVSCSFTNDRDRNDETYGGDFKKV